MKRFLNSNVAAAILVVALIGGFVWSVDFAFRLPVVEKSNHSGEIVRILVDGREVPPSKYPEILKGRFETEYVD